MNMDFSGSLRDGDVHLKYPQIIEQQLKDILEQGGLKISHLRVAERKVPKFSGRGASIHQAEFLQATVKQSEGMSEIRLNEGDFDHVRKVVLEGFADDSHEWALRVASSLDLSTFKMFSYLVEPRSNRPSTADAPGLTNWFETNTDGPPARVGPYEGINELNPVVRSSHERHGFYYWDGEHWGGPADTPEQAKPRALGFAGGPKYWRGRASQ